MDYLWAGMLFIGIFYGALTGNITAVSEAALSSAGEAHGQKKEYLNHAAQ